MQVSGEIRDALMERAGQFGIILDDVSIVRRTIMVSRAGLLFDWVLMFVLHACLRHIWHFHPISPQPSSTKKLVRRLLCRCCLLTPP